MRVVVHAEGRRETGDRGLGPQPGDALHERQLGPVHVLVRRILTEHPESRGEEITFLEPLRLRTHRARGSDLLKPSNLGKLLSFLGERRPNLIVVVVDQDGVKSRRRNLRQSVPDHAPPTVIGVAVQEFEAWLIADEQAVGRVVQADLATPRAPERMKPRAAKELFDQWMSRLDSEGSARARLAIMATCSLDTVAGRCRAFRVFRDDLVRTANGLRE